MDKRLKNYYKSTQTGGRSKVGRIIDYVFFRIIIFCVLYLFIDALVYKPAVFLVTALITLAVVLILELVRKVRFKSFVMKHKRELAQTYMLQAFALLPPAALNDVCYLLSGYNSVYVFQKLSEVTLDDMVIAFRDTQASSLKSIHIYSLSQYSEQAKAFSQSLPDVTIILHDSSELLAAASKLNINITPDRAECILMQSLQKTKKKTSFKKCLLPFIPANIKRYVISGIVLFVMSLFTRQTLYYQLMSMLCFTLAGIALWINLIAKPTKA